MLSLTSAIDDIYDVFGTMEELQLFTEAIERFDVYVNPNIFGIFYLILI